MEDVISIFIVGNERTVARPYAHINIYSCEFDSRISNHEDPVVNAAPDQGKACATRSVRGRVTRCAHRAEGRRWSQPSARLVGCHVGNHGGAPGRAAQLETEIKT